MGGVQTKEDQTLAAGQDATEKAKPVAVDPKAKQLAQAGIFTPEERLTAIKELLAEDIALQKKNGAIGVQQQYHAFYETENGVVLVYAKDEGGKLANITVVRALPNESTPTAAARKEGKIDSDGKFKLLETIISYDPPANIINQQENRTTGFTRKDLSSSESAEKFVDDLIKDALKAKQSVAK